MSISMQHLFEETLISLIIILCVEDYGICCM